MPKETLTLLILGDLHGQMPKLLQKNFDILLCTGDICSEELRPYIKKYLKARNKDENISFRKICSKEKEEELEKKSLERGRKILEKLDKLNKPVIIVPGNWDQSSYLDGKKQGKDKFTQICKGLENIHNVQNKKLRLGELSFVGHGSTSAPEPLDKKSEQDFPDKHSFKDYTQRQSYFAKVYAKLQAHFEKAEPPIILLTHNVPYKTKLDKVHAPQSYAHNKHYGSKIARKLIEEYSPLLCIGGHIHEGQGKTKLGKTLCINAGYGKDINTVVVLDMKKKKVHKVEVLSS
ncbi:MAG: metallophosphoesterase [Candidatus Woesearchaeota archaeon]|nr:metallophosphoesterase [Nanoarchaeota archaeon]USN44811.1 MAG: metallophosphoesterase [Candidatus Woesearchaeota archaeon]